MFARACVLAMVLSLSVRLAAGQTVEASAVAQSLLRDIANARRLLQSNQSPWQDTAARPQPQPLAVLAQELPGNAIWVAFKPVDERVRAAYWLQRQSYLEKDAAVRQRREARELLPALAAAIRAERDRYNPTVINLAVRQVAQADNALVHLEYHAALCVLWSMADLLGLWDRQAALEVAQDHLSDLRHDGAGKSELRASVARGMDRTLETIAQMIETAIAWRPVGESLAGPSIGPSDIGPAGGSRSDAERHFADHAVLGHAFDPWRHGSVVTSGATPLVYDQVNARLALSRPPQETKCLAACPRYRDWQDKLDDHRYGWSPYMDSAARQKPCCDWRALQPWAAWPAAKGADNAGGL